MSMSAKAEAFFGDGRHAFRLGLGELEELQEKTGFGPYELFNRIKADRWRVGDLQQTVRLGLVGAGMAALDAAKLVERYGGPGRLIDCRAPALLALAAAISGDVDDEATQVGEPEGAAMATASPTDA